MKAETIHNIYLKRKQQDDFTPYEEIAETLLNFIVLLEDIKFYRHRGYDTSAIWYAIKHNLKGKAVMGGSTITQQLIKNLFFTFEKKMKRKVKELYLAIRFEHCLSKKEILELYLNVIYYDNGQYGITDACRFYFNKKPSELTLNQAFFLASILSNVGIRNPLYYPEKYLEFRNRKLAHLLDLKFIDQSVYDEIYRHGIDNLDEEICQASPETEKYQLYRPNINERFGPNQQDSLI